MSSRVLILGAAALVLTACDTVYPSSQSVDPSMGEAVKYDMAIQVIDPDPVYTAQDARPGDHGEKGAEAVKRYRKGQVKEAQTQATTSSSGGGGSGPR